MEARGGDDSRWSGGGTLKDRIKAGEDVGGGMAVEGGKRPLSCSVMGGLNTS